MARTAKRPPDDTPVTAAEVLDFLTGYCATPEGPRAGQPLRLAPFQTRFIKEVYDNPYGPTRRGILSTGKKNGKTSLIAGLLLCHLVGPAAKRNSQLNSTAQSLDQASLPFQAARKMTQLNVTLRRAVLVRESRRELICPELGTSFRSLAADAQTAHGLSPQFCIHDELGQVRGPSSELFDTLEMSATTLVNPLTLIISTQAADPEALLSTLIDDALEGEDPATVCHLYAASPDLPDLFSEGVIEDAIRQANPAVGHFLSLEALMAEARRAERLSASRAAFKNFVLNLREDATGKAFLASDVWRACAAPPRDLHRCEVFGGLDLSERKDLTAFALIGQDPIEGDWSVKCWFWLPEERLREQTDGDWLQELADRGLIRVTPGKIIVFDEVARQVVDIIREYRVKVVGFDRARMESFKVSLAKAGMSAQEIEETFSEFGQGLLSMTPAVDTVEEMVLSCKLRHGGDPVLNWCVSNAVVKAGDHGARKLMRMRKGARIDGLIAMTMAFGVVPRRMTEKFDVCALIG
jgi:phage terminase large subunit-like protein